MHWRGVFIYLYYLHIHILGSIGPRRGRNPLPGKFGYNLLLAWANEHIQTTYILKTLPTVDVCVCVVSSLALLVCIERLSPASE